MRLEKILFLYGSGANGKSVFLNIIRALIGAEQCCEYSLEGITKHETHRAELGNYLFNVSTEISTRMSTDVFKKIASREPLQARYLYKSPFNILDYATSVFAMNELPRDVEQTDAFFRRFMLVPFNVRIPDDEQDPDLAKKIIDSEMSGVLNYVIDGMQSLIAEQQFDIPESVRLAVEQFRQESDSVLPFLEENGCRPSVEKWVFLQFVYDRYRAQSIANGRKPVAKSPTFSNRLRSLGYIVEPRGKSKQVVVYLERDVDEWAE
jgi:putative DNA primase/helicase